MKIGYVSDIHLDVGFGGVPLPGGDILLVAGDLIEIRNTKDEHHYGKEHFENFLKECAKYQKVLYIPGNHEFYHGVYPNSLDVMRAALAGSNVELMDDTIFALSNDWFVLGSTLWTDFKLGNPIAMQIARTYMNDYHCIKTPTYRKLNPSDTHAANLRHKVYLKGEVEKFKDKKLIVMTHQTPSFGSCAPRWRVTGDINFAYHNSDLDQWIMDSPQIKYWIHGHTHDSHDYLLGSTRVLCNPRGYGTENMAFDPNAHFEVT